MSDTLRRLAPGHVEYIARYNGFRQEFIELFRATFETENPKFLLAVIDYKKNPRWDSCMSIYNLFIRTEGGGRLAAVGRRADANIVVTTENRINLPESVKRDIDVKMQSRRGQVGGMGDPRIFDAAFMVVVRATNAQYNLKVRVLQFLESRLIHAGSYGEFSTFELVYDASLPP